ncbi:hypothetical protein [Candidatus Hodgkinia cicadicola]|uniref:hypothetical protein n=1 Tax=Candidatus Hodgkinia cicadicola TaxID=573658 RepID=UPI0011BA60B8
MFGNVFDGVNVAMVVRLVDVGLGWGDGFEWVYNTSMKDQSVSGVVDRMGKEGWYNVWEVRKDIFGYLLKYVDNLLDYFDVWDVVYDGGLFWSCLDSLCCVIVVWDQLD